MADRAGLTGAETVLVGAGAVGALTVLITGFVAGGDDGWPVASAPLFVYGALLGLLAAPVLVLLGRATATTVLALGAITVVNAVALLLAGGGSTAAALLVLVCAGLLVPTGVELHRRTS